MQVLLIGGSKGIGKAIAERLAKDGHETAALSRSSSPPLDLAGPSSSIREIVGGTIDGLGGLDALVLSSGEGAYLAPWQEERERLERMMRVNYHGPVDCVHAATKALLRSQGRVLFVGSTVATRGAAGLQHYAATKGAVDAYVRSAARGLARHNVAMNVLSPGWVDTPMTQGIQPRRREKILASIPMRRMAQPEEVADFAARILASPRWLTGQIIEMTGGA